MISEYDRRNWRGRKISQHRYFKQLRSDILDVLKRKCQRLTKTKIFFSYIAHFSWLNILACRNFKNATMNSVTTLPNANDTYNLLGERLNHMHFRGAPSTRLFIHLMNFTSRIFIALSFVSKINSDKRRYWIPACYVRFPEYYRYSHRQILRSKNKLNRMLCIVT